MTETPVTLQTGYFHDKTKISPEPYHRVIYGLLLRILQ